MMVKAMEVSGIEGNFRWACGERWTVRFCTRLRLQLWVAEQGAGHAVCWPCSRTHPTLPLRLSPSPRPRATCNEVMRVLRSNKDSVMAMLEAFVHDPLINWRLLNTGDNLPEAGAPGHAPDASAPGAASGSEGEGAGSSGAPPAPAQPVDLRTGAPSPPRHNMTREQVMAAFGGIGDATEVLNERAVAVMKRMSDKLTGRDAVVEGMVAPSEPDSVAQQVQRLIALATSNEALCQSYIGW